MFNSSLFYMELLLESVETKSRNKKTALDVGLF